MSATARLAADLIESLRNRGETLSCVESLTGGALAKSITDVTGASKVFLGSLVTYSNESKVLLAGVDPALIEKYGVVSSEVVVAMAEGARSRIGSTWSIATTGVAGPGPFGGVAAGLVWIAVAGPHGAIEKLELGDLGRERVRDGAVIGALALITRILREHPER